MENLQFNIYFSKNKNYNYEVLVGWYDEDGRAFSDEIQTNNKKKAQKELRKKYNLYKKHIKNIDYTI